MRFEARYSNGFWKVFDTQRYTGVVLAYLKTDAEAIAAERNAEANKTKENR